MSDLPRIDGKQRTFAQVLLDSTRPCPAGLRAWNGSDPSRRFAVYRNNVVTSLIDALADTYPVVRELVGVEFFAEMARCFATRYPPTGPVLALYGGEFAGFIECFEPAGSVPYLADVARLEWLRVQAFHAADASSLSAVQIGYRLSDTSTLADSELILHPSTALIPSSYAIVSLWAAHQGAGELARIDPMQPETALVLRHEEVLVIAVAPGAATFIQQLRDGATFAEATAAGSAIDDGFDLSGSLALLIRHGAIVAWGPSRSLSP